ncbi:MAG: MBL fold metallo-hydrolase [Clostridia bacterium]|nr:MBL fold metallo-hydrolase [Clostridia bacterium]
MMIRSFLPVGQGACYIEKFNLKDDERQNITVLYDCGSSTSVDTLIACLKENIKEHSNIHAVFISHFDEDHINGLPYILEHYRVKNLFIPLVTEEELSYLQLVCLTGLSFSSNKRFFSSFFKSFHSLHGLIPWDTTIYYVQIYQSDSFKNDQENYKSNRIVPSGEDVTYRLLPNDNNEIVYEWHYVPYNFQQETRYDELLIELEKVFKKRMTLNEILRLVENEPNNIEKIKNAFKKIPGSLNTNSMVLFSGPKNNMVQVKYDVFRSTRFKCCANECCFDHIAKPGCLYMGDYDANGKRKWDGLVRALSEYWESIGCIQVPHHGSKYNYNEELTNDQSRYYVVSVGVYNRYRHPHDYVIKDMLFKGCLFYIVTERKESEASFIVR